MELVIIPDECKLSIKIPPEKFDLTTDDVNCVLWLGNLKPAVTLVEPTITPKQRYEELQFFQVKLHSREKLYEVGKCIYSRVKYPCVIEFVINDVVTIGICKFNAGALDFTENVKKRIFFSHFLRKDLLSDKAQKMVDDINNAISTQKDLGNMYDAICDAISNYRLSGTTMAHVERLITDMLGKTTATQKQLIYQYCEPYKYHAVTSGNRFSGRRASNYMLIHDYEELWYCFMMFPATRKVIENRRYRDIEDLIYSIDSKGW